MTTGRTWTIKGVSDRTRDAAHEAAQAEGLTVGDWVNKALARAAEETLHPRPPTVSRADVAEVVRGLLREELAPLAEKVERLAVARAGNGAASPVEEVRSRLRRRRGL